MNVMDAVHLYIYIFIGRPPKDEKMQTNDEKEILGSSYFENKAFFKS
jgi:hypothetical protein